MLFEAEVVGGRLTHERDGTTDEARWVPPADVTALPHVWVVDTALRLLGRA